MLQDTRVLFTWTIFHKADIIFTPPVPESQGTALSWEHLTVQPRHQQLQCGDRVTELGAVTICRHMNTSSGVSPHQCAGSHTVAGQTCIWASCADIGCWCWHHNLLVTVGALLWLWAGCCEWDKYSDTEQRSAPTLHLMHTSAVFWSWCRLIRSSSAYIQQQNQDFGSNVNTQYSPGVNILLWMLFLIYSDHFKCFLLLKKMTFILCTSQLTREVGWEEAVCGVAATPTATPPPHHDRDTFNS